MQQTGQTLLEFAFILPIVLLLMLGVVQIILVGSASLAVNQAAVSVARYAAINPSADQITLNTYLQQIASPLIKDANLHNVGLQPSTVPRKTGSSVAITVVYSLSNKLFLGSSFFGVSFPTQVSVTETMTSE